MEDNRKYNIIFSVGAGFSDLKICLSDDMQVNVDIDEIFIKNPVFPTGHDAHLYQASSRFIIFNIDRNVMKEMIGNVIFNDF